MVAERCAVDASVSTSVSAEEMSFAVELQTMPAFSSDKDDEERLKTYILQRVPPGLKGDLDAYLLYRTETFAARRAGAA